MGCEATADAGRRDRRIDGLAGILLAATALGGANLYGVASGRGGVAAPSDWTNLAGGLLVAMTPLFVCLRHRARANSRALSPMRATMSAAATTVGTTACLLVTAPIWLLVLLLFVDFVGFWASRERLVALIVVLTIALGMWWQSRRNERQARLAAFATSLAAPTGSPAPAVERPIAPGSQPRPWPAIAMVASWLWLMAVVGLLGLHYANPLEHVGTDGRSGKHYFARQLQRDRGMQRHWLSERTPVLGGWLEWWRIVAVEPSLPVDLTTLRFEDGLVFAECRDGTLVRLELR